MLRAYDAYFSLVSLIIYSRIIICVTINIPCLLDKLFCRRLGRCKASRTTIPIHVINWFLPKLTMYGTDYADRYLGSFIIDLRVIVSFAVLFKGSHDKNFFGSPLPSTAGRTHMPIKKVMGCYPPFSMFRAYDTDLSLSILVLNF